MTGICVVCRRDTKVSDCYVIPEGVILGMPVSTGPYCEDCAALIEGRAKAKAEGAKMVITDSMAEQIIAGLQKMTVAVKKLTVAFKKAGAGTQDFDLPGSDTPAGAEPCACGQADCTDPAHVEARCKACMDPSCDGYCVVRE